MLELRPNCELCDRDLPPDARDARICTYECTVCSDCAERVLCDVCPNCGGNFAPRPIRPRRSHRDGTGLAHDPPSTARRATKWSKPEIAQLVEKLKGIGAGRR